MHDDFDGSFYNVFIVNTPMKHKVFAVTVSFYLCCSSFSEGSVTLRNPSVLPRHRQIEPEPVEYEVLLQGQYAPGNLGVSQIIKNQEALDGIYGRIKGNNAKAPALNFKTHAAVLACAGSFPTGGYSIRFLGLLRSEGAEEKQIVFSVKGPPPGAIVTMAFTSPYMLISLALDSETAASVRIKGGSHSHAPYDGIPLER